jgi:AAA domain (Cdc48 subfamily)/C-terminal, D2-small domain, of ClpB protein
MYTDLENTDGSNTVLAPDLPGVFTISYNLQQAFAAAVKNLPPSRSALTRADLLLAIVQLKGTGSSYLRYALTLTRGEDGSIYNHRTLAELASALVDWQGQAALGEAIAGSLTVADMTWPIAASLRDLLATSRQYASAQPIETGDVVAADAGFPTSILVPILSGWGAQVAGSLLPRYAAAGYSGRPEDVEDGAVVVVFKEEHVVVTPSTVVPAGTSTPGQGEHGGLRDLLAEAKGRPDRTVVRPDLADNLVGALDQAPLVILVTPRAYEAEAAVRDLANLIASDDKGILGYKNLVEPDRADLNSNPYNTISSALSQAAGGILYIPNLQDYVRNANVEGLVEKAINTPNLKLIASLSDEAWKEERAKALYRQGRAILPPSPRLDEIKQILLAQKTNLERRYSRSNLPITIGDPAIAELAKLGARYPVDPLDLLANAVMGIRMSESEGLRKLQHLAFSPDRKVDAVDVDLALQKLTGIVVSPEDPERYLHMEDELRKSIIDQDQAIHVVSEAIITAMGGIKDPKRPTGAFIFMGPTGVGKSELARALANFLFNDPNAVLRFDMSEYMEKHEVARLIGAPPGYVGYEEGGQLTEAVRRKPYSIVLFDEFEKAHPDVMNTTLQILEEGKLTDGKGQVTDFNNTILIFTGNVGSEAYQSIGQSDAEGKVITEARVKEAVREEIRRTFRPEFLNRIGDEPTAPDESNIVIFNTLKREDMRPIEEIELAKLNKLLAENGLALTVSEELETQLAQEGFSEQYGARPLVRLVKRKLGFPIAERTMRGEFKPGDKITASLAKGEIVFSK